MSVNAKTKFIELMLLLRTEKLPERDSLLFELKLDGYRAVAFKTGGKVRLRSRNNKDFSAKYPAIVKALAAMPDDTVIDGERNLERDSERNERERREPAPLAADFGKLFRHHDGAVNVESGDCGFAEAAQ